MTGWKSLFGAGHQVHAGWIDNVTETESEVIKAYCEFLKLVELQNERNQKNDANLRKQF